MLIARNRWLRKIAGVLDRVGQRHFRYRRDEASDLDIRPIYHRLADRVRAHVLPCMLAYYVEWHM